MTDTSSPQVADASELRPRRTRSRGPVLFVRDALIILVVAILVSFLIKTFVVRPYYIPSESMRETLQVDDRILVNELVPSLVPVDRGDVVVFRDPGGWLDGHQPSGPASSGVGTPGDWVLALLGLSSADSNDHLVKRVIGLPGDHVVCCNPLGRMAVDDVPLEEEYVLLPDGVSRVSGMDFDIVVPPDSLWVMGDNRYNSQDSRFHQGLPSGGFVPMANVEGRAVVISWPIGRWTWLDRYASVFRDAGEQEVLDVSAGDYPIARVS